MLTEDRADERPARDLRVDPAEHAALHALFDMFPHERAEALETRPQECSKHIGTLQGRKAKKPQKGWGEPIIERADDLVEWHVRSRVPRMALRILPIGGQRTGVNGKDLLEQFRLPAENPEESDLADPRPLSKGARGGTAEAALCKQLHRGAKDTFPRVSFGHL